ncbi:MAG: demethylmenaquinone methyltransferase/2-methoxy-6-polyprenyl-1,4-benzoquinol methylase [Acidimicrobiales bacterium]|jgi:demethylmenaquinone methyltransferase / 2-methoxy-6-polyprenyl-1,4-benzoquinol methylase
MTKAVSPDAMPTDRLLEGDEKRDAVQQMFDTIAPRYDLVNRVMTFRLDVGIRRKTLKSLALHPGSTVLDLACGTGDFVKALGKGGHTAIGVDLSYGMMAASTVDGSFVQGDLLALPMADNSVDAAVCGYALRNLVALPPFFAELARVVRPGGRIALVDVSAPENGLLKMGYNIHFNRIVPFIGGLLSDKSAYAYLPRSVSYLPEPAEMVAMMTEAGLTNGNRRQLTLGIAQLLTAAVPS